MLLLIKKILLFGIIFYSMTGCNKYLQAKSNQNLVVISSIQDGQSLLDNYVLINLFDPGAGEISADDYYLLYSSWSALSNYYKNIYTWQPGNLFIPGSSNDWGYAYKNVYTANLVLSNMEGLQRTAGDLSEWNSLKGQGLFLRGKTFLQIAWTWAQAYDKKTANSDPGIPLRLDPDFNPVSVRATNQQTYDRVIKDLKASLELLPATAIHVMRPSKAAACGWIARAYLSMRVYDSAELYADKCLQYSNTLIDYNTLDASASKAFSDFNSETIFFSEITKRTPLSYTRSIVDSNLYASYDSNDLRRSLYYYATAPGIYRFKGSYAGIISKDEPFNGIATDEMYLIRAECYARMGNLISSMSDLNTLLIKRWKTGAFVPLTASDPNEALQIIKVERRKELHSRGLRWMDLKRYNKEGDNIILSRILNGQTYTLLPNDPRYALAIPEDVIAASGMVQNSR